MLSTESFSLASEFAGIYSKMERGRASEDRGSKRSLGYYHIATDSQEMWPNRGIFVVRWPDLGGGCIGFSVCMYCPLGFSV